MHSDTRPLVISFGVNGYQWIWKRAIASHKAYCKKHGYDYVFVQKPSFTSLKMESTWLKLPLIISALNSGRQWVMYVDCDAAISENCPSFTSVDEPDKSLFMVNGFSGRVNAGVIIIRNEDNTRALMEKILANALSPIPEEDNVGWGDNSYVITYSKGFPGLKILGTEWNNNQDPDLKDYIRHYSAGPMRQHYHFTLYERMVGIISKFYCKFLEKLYPGSNEKQFYSRLDDMMGIVTENYPIFRETKPKLQGG